ncbi:GNAT family N-acetyltransferase [Paenibacillus paeoniae]|uniref:GNAT family N-acetyltransferase n=1 Tax=Paenibacillus paeoniae TaxID=2292705 RepID=A0A371PL77_9BACL|nr:GNAT family N-acetyltransferase [Paenibacillus paeoniae]REK76970.1 GNAT family N-acetyltransferase [Paenibacillus paeoniae]
MTRIVIREAEQTDAEFIRTILLDAYSQYEQHLPQDRWEQYQEDMKNAVVNEKVKARIVAELDGELVGSVFLYDSSEAAYGLPELHIHSPILRLLAVATKARGHGIATALIRASVNRSLQWGAETLHLHTNDMMGSAIKLYERLGFERAYDKDIIKGDSVVKSYRLLLRSEYSWVTASY